MTARVVILAAGKSTRLNGDVPKVIMPFKGKPMMQHLLDAIVETKIDTRPIIVVGRSADIVKKILGNAYDYVYQEEQRGTGHAVLCAEAKLRGTCDAVIVLYGDHPYVSAVTIEKLYSLHTEKNCVLTMATVAVEDFDEWRKNLYDFGRIIRDGKGTIRAIVEAKDATREELAIRELNPSFFCFRESWLWENLKKLTDKNAKHEYYLTDLVRIAIEEGEHIASFNINPLESIGINTPEHLELAEKIS